MPREIMARIEELGNLLFGTAKRSLPSRLEYLFSGGLISMLCSGDSLVDEIHCGGVRGGKLRVELERGGEEMEVERIKK